MPRSSELLVHGKERADNHRCCFLRKKEPFLFFQFPVEIMWIWGDIWLLLFCFISFAERVMKKKKKDSKPNQMGKKSEGFID